MSEVLRDDHGAISVLTLNNPGQLNALSTRMMDDLGARIYELATDETIRVILVRAAGRNFCAGHDLSELLDPPGGDAEAIFAQGAGLCAELQRMPQTVIAEVQGVATAAGCQLAAACDLVIAAPDARFGLTGINLGLACSSPAVEVARNLPAKLAFDLLMTGRFMSAQEALGYGLISRIAEADLSEAAIEYATVIASKLGPVVVDAKRTFYQQIGQEANLAYRTTGQRMGAQMRYDDTREGITAFLQKRAPNFKNTP